MEYFKFQNLGIEFETIRYFLALETDLGEDDKAINVEPLLKFLQNQVQIRAVVDLDLLQNFDYFFHNFEELWHLSTLSTEQ